jgi:hypothetical protein
MRHIVRIVAVTALWYSASLSPAQVAVDPVLAKEIARIKAIDNHSHDAPALPESVPPAPDGSPLGVTPFGYPVRLRVDNPEWVEAWRALYGYTFSDMSPEHARMALLAKRQRKVDLGTAYPAWVLDRAGIELAFVDSDTLGPGLSAPRFRWVPFADKLLFPLDDTKPLFKRLLAESGMDSLPVELGRYTAGVVTPTLERWRRAGALAVKLGVAYRRPLSFADVTETDAAQIYRRWAGKGQAPTTEYMVLQDYLFGFLAREAGRLGLVVHIHTGIGANPFFSIAGSDPTLLEPALNNPALRKTLFVLIHGGWPYEKQAGVMLIKPNVYADFSAQTFLRSPRALSEALRGWLEWYPEKVLFGTDAYSDPGTPLSDWEEKTWLTTTSAREALGIALTGMMRDREITRGRALELARLVLRDNANRLYRFSER